MEEGNGRKKKRKRLKESHWKKRNKIGKEKEKVGLRKKAASFFVLYYIFIEKINISNFVLS
jgi:hypothetical protein